MNKSLYPLHGIVTVLNTPFSSAGTIDYNSLKKNVREALRAGVAGFLVPAMAAEVHTLTHQERLNLVQTVLEEVNQQVPVIAGAAESDMAKCKSLLKGYLDIGCREVLFQIPYQNEQQFKTDFYALAEIDVDMIMLQDWDPVGAGLPEALICDLFDTVPAFRCLKVETVMAGYKYSRLLLLTEGLLHVSGGWAVTQLIDGLERGVHAFMPTGMHWIYTEIYQRWVGGRKADAEALFHEILPVLAFSNQHLDASIHFFKRLLFLQGTYPSDHVRKSSIPIDAQHEKMADRLIRRVIDCENLLKTARQNR
ncbi:dihydrodipicolinate synthase family protein [Lunatimonas salinarum]|uniref:dihydrodipicolinate synthase family protein n=1 Tax=Lunatimonas salinarum TaxID=1774590 RepID=UPI001ADFE587|nr:dihydrodipicolinate synthase family protein [Lunatimonas salinarum]